MGFHGRLYEVRSGELAPLEHNYCEGLNSSVQQRVQLLDDEFYNLQSETMQSMYRMGEIFIELKEILPHGNYLEWQRHRELNDSTVNAWVNVVRRFSLEQLKGFNPSAARILAAPSLPDAAREEALELSKSQPVNVRAAQYIRSRYAVPSTPDDPENPATGKRINPNKVVGLRLTNIREDRDMKQDELADGINELLLKSGAIGLPLNGQSVISKLEYGLRSMSFLEGLAASYVLNVSPEVFAPWNSGEYDYRVS